jgi:hypothetical protein
MYELVLGSNVYTQCTKVSDTRKVQTGDSTCASFIRHATCYFRDSYTRTRRSTKDPTAVTTAAYLYLNVG